MVDQFPSRREVQSTLNTRRIIEASRKKAEEQRKKADDLLKRMKERMRQ